MLITCKIFMNNVLDIGTMMIIKVYTNQSKLGWKHTIVRRLKYHWEENTDKTHNNKIIK